MRAGFVAPNAGASQRPLHLQIIRAVRTFDPRAFLHKNVGGIYVAIVLGLFVYANHRQAGRMRKLYPDYSSVAKGTGAQYSDMKQQELADVMSFNRRAQLMRSDLRSRMPGEP